MKRYLPLALLAVFAVAGCDKAADGQQTADTAAPTAAEAPMDDAATQAAAEAAAKASADPASAAVAEAVAADAANASDAAPAASNDPIPGLKLGTDYVVIKGGQPFEPLDGKVEVVEIFNYVCPACNAMQPLLTKWKQTLPPDVRFTYIPAAFGGNWDQYVRSFYTAQMMGVLEKAHERTYDAIHLEGRLKGERGDDSDAEIAAFYAQFGVDAKVFAGNMRSFAVTGKFNKAKQYIIQQQVGGTPTIIVNGKYQAKGRNWPDALRIASRLIEHARTESAAPAATP
jgi:thiol:disulfide interchange protein DsbA